MIRQEIQTAIQGMGGAGTGGAGAPAAGGKAPKMDPNQAAVDSYQTKTLLIHLYKAMGLPLPDNILAGPNRDPATGLPMQPGAPGSTSDPNVAAQTSGAAQQPQSAIQPIEPMQPAMPTPPGAGAPKAAADEWVDALLRMGRPVAPTVTPGDKAGAIGSILGAIQRKRASANRGA